MKRYKEYKDSGVEWIGEIPSHWEVKKINHELDLLTDYVANGSFESLAKNVEYLDEPDYAILLRTQDYNKQFEGPFVYISEKSYNFLKKSELIEGDLVISNVGSVGTIFKVPKLDRPTSLAPNAILVRTKQCNEYIYYFIKSTVGQKSLEDITSFTAQPKFNKTSFRTIKILVPKMEEQIKIVEYLDKRTLKIDNIISKKEELIETLKASRTKLISETVTKGLDKNIPMKDSGVEWIGEIPSHWEVKKLKHISERIEVGIAESTTDSYSESGIPIIRSTNVDNSTVDTNNLLYIKESFANKNKSKYLYEGDLITVRTGNVGRTAVITKELNKSQCFTMLMTTLRCKNNPYFYNYYMNSSLVKSYLELISWGTAQQNISVAILKELLVVSLTEKEQEEIVKYLDNKVQKIDKNILKIEEQIEFLKKAKQKLITEVVTGKIDVTNI